MKTIITAVAILALTATTTFAGGFNSPSASANQAQGQGQAQGQLQGQAQGQSQNTNQANSQSITYEGTASSPGIGGCEIGLSGGIVGTSAGLCFPSMTGNSVRVANALIAAGRPDLAVPVLMNTPVAKRAHRNVATVSTKAPVAKAGFTKCELTGNKLTIRYRGGADKVAAKAACLASHGL